MRAASLGASLLVLTCTGAALAQTLPSGSLTVVSPAPAVWAPAETSTSGWTSTGGDGGGGSSFWGNVEYLLWWVKNGPLPPALVLTGDPNTPNPGALNAGGLPVPGVSSVNYGPLSGVRATVGGWLNSDGTLGVEASGFLLPQWSKTYRFASDGNGNPVLGFRYLDTPVNPVTPLAEDVFQASIPPGNPFGVGPFAGKLAVVSQIRLWGSEINAVAGLVNNGNLRLQALGGFRYADLTESVSLQLQSTALDGASVTFQGNAFPSPATIATTDIFRTRNQFYGGQIGFRGEYDLGNFCVGVTGKVALGSNHEVVEVAGTSTLFPGVGPNASVPVGQFAGPSNIGRRTSDQFAVIPEVEVKLGYKVTNNLRGWIGYDFLYWSRVVRPGNQVDLVVNDSVNPVNGAFGVPPLDRSLFPRPLFDKSDFWAQGVTFGLELRY